MSDKKNIEWISMNDKALRGGIIVNGSIGSGKSVATLLPWAEQLLEFNPRPSFFIGDPKSTFSDDFLELVEKKGLSSELEHFSLDGQVRYNPIYKKNMLRDGGFSEVGQMIRAAQINFMGRESGDGKFWGSKANDLVKNILRYCAGTLGDYFTLIDFYTALIEVSKGDFALEIENALGQKNFDEEEKINLKFALQYFEYEYKSLDDKIKSGITSTATSFLSQLMEYKASKIICPKEEEVTFWSFDDLIDSGKIFVLDIRNQGLAKAIGTIAKLQYQASVLRRNTDPERRKHNKRLAVSIIDEYPSVASFGASEGLGDDTYRATCRSAGGVDLYAMQGHTSLYSALNDKEACDTLLLNFRTHVCLNSIDSKTADFFEKMGGEYEVEKENESFSESGKDPRRDLLSGEVIAKNSNITRSVSRTKEKKKRVTAEKLSQLKTFEAVGLVFTDGIETKFFDNICLKPSFIENKSMPHEEILNLTRGEDTKKSFWKKYISGVIILFSFMFSFSNSAQAFDFPTVCSVINTPQFAQILNFQTSVCTCGYPPRPCLRMSYYIPSTYLETRSDSGSMFKTLPGAAMQLSSVSHSKTTIGGIGEEGGYFYHSRALTIPFTSLSLGRLPCGGAPEDKFCFDAMSEHLGKNWMTPTGDYLQPQFLAWKAIGPKLCALKGAASSVTGSPSQYSPAGPMCSMKMDFLPKYPPSVEPVCTGWGQLMPRTGFVDASSSINASLVASARLKSLGTEVFRSTASHPDEKWQMIYPNSSGAFRRGQNLGFVAANLANERGRMNPSKSKGYLYAVWQKVSCCKDIDSAPEAAVILAYAKAVCAGLQ